MEKTMTLKPGSEADWQKSLDNNRDPYGARLNEYANDWALLMEEQMANGAALEDIAKETSHVADTDGITGFMYSCAVSILSAVWIHGEDLRKWHNLKYQIGNEGEKANEKGSVLNTAILNIGDPENNG